MNENGEDSTTSCEPKQTETCESGTDVKDLRPVALVSEYALERKYSEALDGIRKTLAECDTTTTQPLIDIDIILKSVGR